MFVSAVGGHRELLHRGDIPGGAAFKAHYPGAGLTVVVLANTLGAPAARLGRRVARLALGLPDPRPADLPLAAAERGRLAGTYRDGRGAVAVADRGGRLAAATPDGPVTLLPIEAVRAAPSPRAPAALAALGVGIDGMSMPGSPGRSAGGADDSWADQPWRDH